MRKFMKLCQYFVKNSTKLRKLKMKFLKNLYRMLGKILFAKFLSKIILKVSRVKFAEKILRKF